MSLSGASLELQQALKAARETWETVQQVWKDSACRAFEQDSWAPLETRVRATLQAMEQVGAVLSRAVRECS
jgi:uncharacterized protein YukE